MSQIQVNAPPQLEDFAPLLVEMAKVLPEYRQEVSALAAAFVAGMNAQMDITPRAAV